MRRDSIGAGTVLAPIWETPPSDTRPSPDSGPGPSVATPGRRGYPPTARQELADLPAAASTSSMPTVQQRRTPAAGGLDIREVIKSLERRGWIGHLGLILACSAWVCLALPATPMEVAAGFVYGPLRGFACGLLCKLLGSCASFLMARRLGRMYGCKVPASLGVRSSALNKRPVLTMVGIRLTPIPLAVKNYGLGLSEVRLAHYIVACLSADAPFSALWASTGASCHSLPDALELDPARVLGSEQLVTGRVVPSFLVLGLLGYIAWSWHRGSRARKDKDTPEY
jgi:uncharacterized membrane protein YdjX (TVP38/TMEM64 family)